MLLIFKFVRILQLVFLIIFWSACKNIKSVHSSTKNNFELVPDSLMHKVELKTSNRGYLFSQFQRDYLFRMCLFSNDSLRIIEKKIYDYMINEPRLHAIDIKANFLKFHRQYLIAQFDGNDYLFIYYIFFAPGSNIPEYKSTFWDFPNLGITGGHVKQFYISYPLTGDDKISLTTNYF